MSDFHMIDVRNCPADSVYIHYFPINTTKKNNKILHRNLHHSEFASIDLILLTTFTQTNLNAAEMFANLLYLLIIGASTVKSHYNETEGSPYMPQLIKDRYGDKFERRLMAERAQNASLTETRENLIATENHRALLPMSVQRFRGGCRSQPRAPLNSAMRCSLYNGCRATCKPYHFFPNGTSVLSIRCESGFWKVENDEYPHIPDCQMIACSPSCRNNGVCVGRNECKCREHFYGSFCQHEHQPCLYIPNIPANAQISCRSLYECKVQCLSGHKLPDNSAEAKMACSEGLWVPENVKWVSVPNCERM